MGIFNLILDAILGLLTGLDIYGIMVALITYRAYPQYRVVKRHYKDRNLLTWLAIILFVITYWIFCIPKSDSFQIKITVMILEIIVVLLLVKANKIGENR
ncbi:putative membrane protein [Weissella uvarum]|uniref:hypothetical protein n=1 Tax=Weissella uvarum TaxID=1479233 RepID=UPI001961F5AD|nr:hypothetical protein [Weissella uvarum]MBM7617907.1 putative membrane protein [Weissella uvarum]MCM0596096.1 hypothetical protein [Weissella uvarum]